VNIKVSQKSPIDSWEINFSLKNPKLLFLRKEKNKEEEINDMSGRKGRREERCGGRERKGESRRVDSLL
jgi:hypothetical protein